MANQRNETTEEIIQEAIGLGADPNVCPQPSLYDVAYLAGIIDGEGCIMVAAGTGRWHKQHQLRVTVSGTSLDLMLYLHKKFGARLTRVKRYSEKWKPGFASMWYSNNAKQIVEMVYPYLRVKKRQAEVALRWPCDKSRQPEFRQVLYEELRRLNRKGN